MLLKLLPSESTSDKCLLQKLGWGSVTSHPTYEAWFSYLRKLLNFAILVVGGFIGLARLDSVFYDLSHIAAYPMCLLALGNSKTMRRCTCPDIFAGQR